jgi:arylsulfatase A
MPRLLALALLLAFARLLAADAPRPNFVLINIDDLGYREIGAFGSPHLTPALDRMAAEGRKLTSHYAAPVCSPSRAALMTLSLIHI